MLKVGFIVALPAAGILLVPGPAFAQGESCRRGEDVRVIEVLAPGTVGAACDVRVTRDGGAQVNTPYHANVDRNFCRAMAAELASQLTAEGFECATALSGALEAALAGGGAPPAPPAAQGDLAQLPLDQQAEQLGLAGGAGGAGAPVAPPEPTSAREPAAASLAMAPIPDAPREPQQPVAAPPSLSLDGIVEAEAPSTPVVLTEGAKPSAERTPRPGRNGAGRLVGAQPALEDVIAVPVKTAEAAPPVPASDGALAPRPAEEIVKGVLAANAAAWNEGNLTAFLAGYVQDGDLRLVDGGEVVSGINAVRKHYQQRIAAAGTMGRLGFSDLDVRVTAPEVATVVGRYTLEAGPAKSAGAATIVLRRVDGRWRIVQDTRVKDPEVPTLAPVNQAQP